MKESTWNTIEEMFVRYPFKCAGEVGVVEIDAASEEIGVPFTSDYREFVRRYGGAVVGPYPIFGLRRAEPMGSNEASVVEVTRRFREDGWPGTDAWAIFSRDHAGNPIGLAHDGKVWISDHDAGDVQIIAENFEDYLRQRCLKLSD